MRFNINNSYVELSIDECEDNMLTVDCVWVDNIDRGQGLGTQLMQLAIAYANEQGMGLNLCAEPQDETTDKARLIEWYRSLGFESHSDCDSLMYY